ncbi:helix-turn-helix domain-containing protein [Corynebacterium marquesiae]|uniref:helix-turn-helix domain-containing protein n=1 Tax=Corynebacterium marquesiae TaxID=2913503 RepID=UPI0040429E60
MSEGNGDSAPKKRGSNEAKAWAHERAEQFGLAVQFWRKKIELTAVELSNRTREIGYPITRATIAKIESNQRNSKMDFLEICVLAAALEVTPADLVFFGHPAREIKITPRSTVTSADATEWFYGGLLYNQFADIHNPRLTQSHNHRQTLANFNQAVDSFVERFKPGRFGNEWIVNADHEGAKDGIASPAIQALLSTYYDEIKRLRDEHIREGGYVELPGWVGAMRVAPF